MRKTVAFHKWEVNRMVSCDAVGFVKICGELDFIADCAFRASGELSKRCGEREGGKPFGRKRMRGGHASQKGRKE
jgi:hypothetical protein